MQYIPCLSVLVLLAIPGAARADIFPADAGFLNVKDFGAQGNGRTDDTAAFLEAIAASGEDTGTTFWQDKIVYVPNGTYLVSSPLVKRYQTGKFGSGLLLLGESQTGTIIRLPDHAAGYGDPQHPQAVVFTTSKLHDGTATSGGKDYNGLGEGNDAYMNFVENLTIDVGSGNSGAIALDYLANNIGAVRNVTLRAQSGSGAVGLSMTRKWPGPALIQNVTVQGFATGIATAQTEYGLTLEHIRLYDQTTAALQNSQNALAIRDIEIRAPSPTVINAGDKSFMAFDDVRPGNAPDVGSFMRNDGRAIFRGLTLSGGKIDGILAGRSQWTAASPPDWRIPLADFPEAGNLPLSTWVSPGRFGATGAADQDATDALRSAMATGAPVLYLPHGTYTIRDAVEIPSSLRRIVGMNSTIKVLAKRLPTFSRGSGMMRILSGGESLSIERLAFDNSNMGDQLAIEAAGNRDVAIRDVVSAGVTLLDRKAGGGRVFLEDVCCGKILTAGPAPLFARQLDTEGGGVRIANSGSPLSVLGLKTEGINTIVDNSSGALTDIFGGLVYMVRDGADASVPAFRNNGASLSASFAEESLRSGSRYAIYVGRGSGDARPPVAVTDFPERGFGRFVPGLKD